MTQTIKFYESIKWSYKGIPQAGQALGKLRHRVVKVTCPRLQQVNIRTGFRLLVLDPASILDFSSILSWLQMFGKRKEKECLEKNDRYKIIKNFDDQAKKTRNSKNMSLLYTRHKCI